MSFSLAKLELPHKVVCDFFLTSHEVENFGYSVYVNKREF